ncbi:hypothetical protein L1887_14290 [Cichorium endivia]|nr:hypothetical protein L1887_14290 [Cichorium endivia]
MNRHLQFLGIVEAGRLINESTKNAIRGIKRKEEDADLGLSVTFSPLEAQFLVAQDFSSSLASDLAHFGHYLT